jgi:cytochrome P450
MRFAVRPIEALRAWQRRYGDAFTVRYPVFGTGVYVADPEAIRSLLTGDQSDLLAGEANSFMSPVLGSSSVLVLDGPEHLRQRKLLLPPFQGSRVVAFREVIRDVTERELETWQPGRRLVLRARMRALTFEVICRAVFGVTEPDLAERDDVLSLLLRARDEDGREMSDRELRDELFTMLAAGHETTATELAFAFELLLHNPPVLERLRSELEAGEGDAYLEAVVKETLRLRPVIDANERTLTKPRVVAGWELPAGVKVFPAILLTQLREDLYPEARRFRPERFLKGEAEPYSWVPFGGGIRRCVGAALAQAEIAEVLRAVVPAVELRTVRQRPDPVVLRGITLATQHGVVVDVLGTRARSRVPAQAAVAA